MDWTVRTTEIADADAALALVQECFEGYRRFGPPGWEPPLETRNLARTRDELADPGTYSRLALAGDGTPAGLVHFVVPDPPYDARLRYLFIAEPFWGSGLARELHAGAVEALSGRSARLFTPAPHARARRFYEREGWTLVGEADESDFGMPLVVYRR